MAAKREASGERSAGVAASSLLGSAGAIRSVVVLHVLTAADEDVVAGLAEQDVLAVATAQDVVALPADEAIATVASDDDVVATEAEDERRTVLARDPIVAFRSDDDLLEGHPFALWWRRRWPGRLVGPAAHLRHEVADRAVRHAEPQADRRGCDQQGRSHEGEDPERRRGVAHRDQVGGVARRRRNRTTS